MLLRPQRTNLTDVEMKPDASIERTWELALRRLKAALTPDRDGQVRLTEVRGWRHIVLGLAALSGFEMPDWAKEK